MAIDSTLLSILACPQDKGPLLLVGDELLYNLRLRRAYPIENGIPVLLIDEARDVADDEHEKLLARAEG
ncbi:Trm112 family protein [Rhodococcus sp. 3Y1]